MSGPHPPRRQGRIELVIDLISIRDRTGPSRLLDSVEGRSKQAFKTWLAQWPEARRKGCEVVAMVPRERGVPPGFTGFKTTPQSCPTRSR